MRKPVLSILFVVLLTVGAIAEAQQPTKIPPHRIPKSYFSFRFPDPHRGLPPGSARAWVREGKNIIIEYRYAEQNFDRLPRSRLS